MTTQHGIDVLGAAPLAGYTDAKTVKAVQEKLIEISNALPASDARKAEFSCGKAGADGIPGPDTARAVKALQAANGKPQTGVIDDWVLTMFHIEAPSGLLDSLANMFGAKQSTEPAKSAAVTSRPAPSPSPAITKPAPTVQVPAVSQASVLPASLDEIPTWAKACAVGGLAAAGFGLYLSMRHPRTVQ